MIIPIRCFTCGKVLADKWNEYARRCAELDKASAEGERPRAGDDGKTARQGGDASSTTWASSRAAES